MRWLISASKTATCASNAVKVSTSSFRMMRTLSGSGDWRSSTRADLSALSRRHLRRHCSPWPTRKTAGSTLSAQAVLVRPQSGHSIAAPEAAGYLGNRHQAFARGAVDPGTCVMGAKYRRWQNLQHRYGDGRYLWDAVHTRLSTLPAESFWSVEAPGFGTPTLVTPRLGQGTFRVAVTDAYQRRCAVTEERTLPVLEAAHIRPYGRGGGHEIINGLLLRSDLHKLFDRGYAL